MVSDTAGYESARRFFLYYSGESSVRKKASTTSLEQAVTHNGDKNSSDIAIKLRAKPLYVSFRNADSRK